MATPTIAKLPTATKVEHANGPVTQVEPDDPHIPANYVVDRIVSHRKRGARTLYRIEWYGYHPSDDTFVPPDHIRQHLSARYWRRITTR